MKVRYKEERKRFSVNGDPTPLTALHEPYLRVAREWLEAVKLDMRRFDLKQDGVRRRLSNGVTITVASDMNGVNDRDEITIDVPYSTSGGGESSSKSETHPYLWVGVRVRYEDYANPEEALQNYAVGLLVIEPGANGMVGNWLWDPVATNTQIRPTSLSWAPAPINLALQDADWTQYRTRVPPGRHMYAADDFQQAPAGIFDFYRGTIHFTRNLLRMYNIDVTARANAQAQQDGWQSWCLDPHDPLGTEEELAARVFPSTYGSYSKTLWDQVVVLDPDEGGMKPTSKRPEDRAALNALSQVTGIAGDGMVLAGDYVIKLCAMGQQCATSNQPWPYSTWGWNEDRTIYPEPLRLDLEVRVGKEPNTKTERYLVVIDQYAELERLVYPFGMQQAGGDCPNLFGSNPHATNWWQAAVLADVKSNKISLVESYVPDVFVPQSWDFLCNGTEWSIYVELFSPYSDYASGGYAAEVARQVWGMQDDAREGVYGQISLPQRTEAEVAEAFQAIANPSTVNGLYRYSVETNTFEKVAWDVYANGNEDAWITYYGDQEAQACRGVAMGVVRLGKGDPYAIVPQYFVPPTGDNYYRCCPEGGA